MPRTLDKSDDFDNEGDVAECPECGGEVYDDAERCPSCGRWFLEGDRESMWKTYRGRGGTAKPGSGIPYFKFVAILLIIVFVLYLFVPGF